MILVRYLSTALTESLIRLSGIPSGPFALFTLDNLTILFIAFLEAQGNSKLKESGKTLSFMVRTLGWFL